MSVCFWCHKNCGGSCLQLKGSTQMRPRDPAYRWLIDGVTSTPTVHSEDCYICRDPEFAAMGLSLCFPCGACGGHVAADDTVCDGCGVDQQEHEAKDQNR